ncbi:MAG: mannonate dehydratase [Chitinophagaceae bacterium]|nr:mannonate dehydratase [Chitinophagaceae bacterium]
MNEKIGLPETWRWFGPGDPVKLESIRQTGAKGIVTALHHIPHGEVWPLEELMERKQAIEQAGMHWHIVESIPVHENIKTRTGNYNKLLDNYRKNLENVAACGVDTVCYNFMPVLDWTRTDLDYLLPDGSRALRFSFTDLALFDIFILKRTGAENCYSDGHLVSAEVKWKSATEEWKKRLTDTILMGVPGEAPTTLETLLESINIYKGIGASGLRENLFYSLESIMECCEENNIRMTIHPDDPPFNILGLPRIVSTHQHLVEIIRQVNHPSNGICFCTGSLGASKHNDLPGILKSIGSRIYFAHLRNVSREKDGSFFEASHLTGDTDMYQVVKELLRLQKDRNEKIPFRPDHGHVMLDDLKKNSLPGYPAIGRMKGLAELRGLAMGIEKSGLTIKQESEII